jgi:hypothetical protein
MTHLIPYTHWAYFDDCDAATACAKELDATFDCLTYVERSCDDEDWLLRAARTIDLDSRINHHDEIEPVVDRHGGTYDFGKACMFVRPAEGRQR